MRRILRFIAIATAAGVMLAAQTPAWSQEKEGPTPAPSPSPSPPLTPQQKAHKDTQEAAAKAVAAWDGLQAARCAGSATAIADAQKAFDEANRELAVQMGAEVALEDEVKSAEAMVETMRSQAPWVLSDAKSKRNEVRRRALERLSARLREEGYLFRKATCPEPTTSRSPPSPNPMPKPRKTSGMLGQILGHVAIGVAIGAAGEPRARPGAEKTRAPPAASGDE